jgi:hypothetical protein
VGIWVKIIRALTAGMGKEQLQKLALWIQQELGSLDHGEIHITLKVRDKHLALIEKTKIVKEKPE